MKLSERQTAALIALADHNVPITGSVLADQMRADGRQTSVAAAHQAANGLDLKGLAMKRYAKGRSVRYEISDKGRELAAQHRHRATGED